MNFMFRCVYKNLSSNILRISSKNLRCINTGFICYQSAEFSCSNSFVVRKNLYGLVNINSNRFSSNLRKEKQEQEKVATVNAPTEKVNQRARLKQAVRDYGATIIVFHVAISLASLGISYLAVSNGLDVVQVLKYLGFSEAIISSKVAAEGSTFVVAYALHKCFAPVRIGCTLTIAPLIVRYLRKINWIKPPKKV